VKLTPAGCSPATAAREGREGRGRGEAGWESPPAAFAMIMIYNLKS